MCESNQMYSSKLGRLIHGNAIELLIGEFRIGLN